MRFGSFHRLGIVAAVCVVVSGCCTVTMYQPMRALSRPTALDTTSANFKGTRILLRCFVTEEFPSDSAYTVCRNLSTVFGQQGAETSTLVPRSEDDNSSEAFDSGPPDLIVDVKSRNEHAEDRAWLVPLWVLSLTAVPTVEEQTYAVRVLVRGRDGSVLADELMRARFVRYNGVLVWSINWLLDWIVREEDEEIMGDIAQKDFSRDFYRQASQLAYNARVRSELLGLTKRAPRAASPAPAPAELR